MSASTLPLNVTAGIPGREAAGKENITLLTHHQPFAIFPSILQVTGDDSARII